MVHSHNWYTTREAVLRASDIGKGSELLLVDDAIEAASREIDQLLKRFILPQRRHTHEYIVPDGKMVYLAHDLLELNSVTKEDGTAITALATDVDKYPKNYGPPYFWISSDKFYAGEAIKVTSVCGYSNETKNLSTLGAGISATDTFGIVTNSGVFEVGQTIQASGSSEMLFVTDKQFVGSVSLAVPQILDASAADTDLITSGRVYPHEQILIGSEIMHIQRVAPFGGQWKCVVERAYNNTNLEQHTDVTTGTVDREINFDRAVNNSQATAIGPNTMFVNIQIPYDIRNLCTAFATTFLVMDSSSWSGVSSLSENVIRMSSDPITQLMKRVQDYHCKRVF